MSWVSWLFGWTSNAEDGPKEGPKEGPKDGPKDGLSPEINLSVIVDNGPHDAMETFELDQVEVIDEVEEEEEEQEKKEEKEEKELPKLEAPPKKPHKKQRTSEYVLNMMREPKFKQPKEKHEKQRKTIYCDGCYEKHAMAEPTICRTCKRVFCAKYENELQCYHCLIEGCFLCNTEWCQAEILTNMSNEKTVTFCRADCARTELGRCQRLSNKIEPIKF
jgi:hypothetical protein